MNDSNASTITDKTRFNWVAKWFAISLGVMILLISLTLGAFTLVMARVPEYRAQMQSWLSERAKLDIQFATLSAGWRGYGPELKFTAATLRSADRQRVIAVAEQGSVGFDLWQALRTGRLSAARFQLEGTELKLQRNADGSFELIGQADWPEFNSGRAFKLDSLPVGELAIRKVRLSFRDLKTGRGPWQFPEVSLDITRDTRRFVLRGSAALPGTLGKALEFSGSGTGNLNDVSQLVWQVSAKGTQFDLSGWKQVMPDDWPAPVRGQGSFQLSGRFVGAQPQHFEGNINFVDVGLRLPVWSQPLPQADPLRRRDDEDNVAAANSLVNSEANSEVNPVVPVASSTGVMVAPQAWQYGNVALQFSSDRTAAGWLTRFDNLQLARSDSPWPASTASVLLKFAAAQPSGDVRVSAAQVNAQLLVLENLWPLLAYAPEGEALARVRALYASGQLRNLALRYERDSVAAEPRFGMRFEFAQIGLSPVLRTPGVSGLSGSVTATGARGTLQLDSHSLALSAPRIFRTPLPMDRVTGKLEWLRTAQQLQLHSRDLKIETENGKVQAQGSLQVPRDGVAQVSMQATANDIDVSAAPRYLPAGILRSKTLAWLDAAFVSGRVQQARIKLQGPLKNFPYRNNEGEFAIDAQLEKLTLNYQNGWQPATGLQVRAEFRNAGLSATASAGYLNGLVLDHVEGSLKDYRDAEIFIKAQAHGELPQGLSFVQQSPVGPQIGDLFMRLSGEGPLQARADLYLPLREFAKRRIDIDVGLDKGRINLAGYTQAAEQVTGSLHIANNAVTAADLSGRFLQGNFRAKAEPVATDRNSTARYNLVATGQAQAQPVVQFLKFPAWVKLSGAASYRFTMPGYAQRDANGVRHLYSVDSDLQGLFINLPAPANKPASIARNLHIDMDMSGGDSAKLMQLRGSLGELRALVRWQDVANQWQFDRGTLRADAVAAALPAHTGLRIEGRLDNFTLDDWLRLGDGAEANTQPAGAVGTRVQDVLRAANVNIGRFNLYGFEWPDVRAVMQVTDKGWRVDVAGPQASGQVMVPYDFGGGQPLTLDMDSLWLTSRVNNQSAGKPDSRKEIDPRDLPAIRADIKHFQYGEHDFGALYASGTRMAQGLQLDSLRISGESFKGAGKGSWLQNGAGSLAHLALSVDSTDVRATMRQFNYADFIAAKRGKLVADLQWPGGLDENLLGRSSGKLEIQVDEGQLVNVEPGAGRVLGLLSVAALPRRLGLDFRDVTDKGLAFDTIHADFTVQNGEARTQNLLLRGPTAEIGIAGRLGLGARDYDQTAVVTGDVRGALAGAGVMAGGPVVGAAVLLFSQLFKEPLRGVARAYYHIGGSWEDPQVERIDADAGKASLSDADTSIKQ